MRSRSSCILVVIAGCNRVFGVGSVSEQQPVFDAPIDAPFTCPPVGTVPAFAHDSLVQVLVEECGFYTQSEDGSRAMGTCNGAIAEGATGGAPLAAAPGFENSATVVDGAPRLGPDGTTATIVRHTIDPTGMNPILFEALLVQRDATAWQVASTITNTVPILAVSQPTRGPDSHVIVDEVTLGLHEFVASGSGWAERSTFTFPHFDHVSRIQMSHDGLRAWWAFQFDVYYADRPTIDDAFTELGPVPGGHGLANAFIDSQCGGLYFVTLGRIWRAPRI